MTYKASTPSEYINAVDEPRRLGNWRAIQFL